MRPLHIELHNGVAKQQKAGSDEQDAKNVLHLLVLRLLAADCVERYEDCQDELEEQLSEQAEDEEVDEEFYGDAGLKRALCGLAKKSRIFGGLGDVEIEHQRSAYDPNDGVGDEACVPQGQLPAGPNLQCDPTQHPQQRQQQEGMRQELDNIGDSGPQVPAREDPGCSNSKPDERG